ncbi:MAG: hypothetical protein GX146_08945 [Myxococcales bacterium]|nr:hypothetical protein [Myxococcales bacterium]
MGTDIEVRDLFFNTPARLKFLKAEGTEGGHCAEALVRLALMRPHIAFKMTSNGRTVRAYHRTQSVAERLHHVFPGEALGKAQGTELGVEVLALLTAPEKARPGAGNLYTYVNGRFVRDRALLRAVSQAFGGTLGAGRYPSGLVALTLPPGSFDINVHPQKTEVRFSDPQAVFRAVSRVVGTMVARTIWSQMPQHADVPAPHQSSDVPVPRPFTSAAHTAEPRTSATATHSAPRPFPAPAPSAPRPFPAPGPQPAAPAARTPQQTALPASGAHDPKAHPYSRLPYLGQAQGTFLLFDDTDDLVFIDQHAAHERVTYERLRQQHQQGQVQTQRLLMPQHVDLGPAEADRILSMAPELERLGLTVEASGPERVAIRAVPAALGNAAPDRLLADMVLALEEHRAGSKGETDDHALATMACHASIRAGKILTADEVHALLRAMDAIDFAGHCPHGRPVAFRIPWSEIRRRVQRT